LTGYYFIVILVYIRSQRRRSQRGQMFK